MTAVPQYVALRDGDEWVGPDELRQYITVYEEYDPESEQKVAFIGGGLMVQTLGVILASAILVSIGLTEIAASIVSFSLGITVFYLIYNFTFSVYNGHPAGDFSGIWSVSRASALAVAVFFFVPHTALCLWL